MMWTEKPGDPEWEPPELVVLKQKLAKLSSSICRCLTDRPNVTLPDSTVHVRSNDKEIQVRRQTFNLIDQFTQLSTSSIREESEQLKNSLVKDVLCPSCFITMTLLRGGAVKILKDEQSETKRDMFNCDKSTENIVKLVDKSTSFAVDAGAYSDLLSEDFFSSDLSLIHETAKGHLVKFAENALQQTFSFDSPPCLCVEKFMDTIRPPLHRCAYSCA